MLVGGRDCERRPPGLGACGPLLCCDPVQVAVVHADMGDRHAVRDGGVGLAHVQSEPAVVSLEYAWAADVRGKKKVEDQPAARARVVEPGARDRWE